MQSAGIDIELVKRVLGEALDEGKSQRGLAREAGLQQDAVRDIMNGKNKNPTIATLAPLARALGKPLSVFGLHFVSEAELKRAIYEALPEMPSRGRDRQAQYLAEVVSGVLSLPEDPEDRQQ